MLRNTITFAVVALSVTVALAEQRAKPRADVRLDNGTLHGQLVVETGHAVQGAQVQLLNSEGRPLTAVRTAADGHFSFAQVRPGVYTLAAGQQQTSVRVWSPQAAPPTAGAAVLMVVGNAVRGQLGRRVVNSNLNPVRHLRRWKERGGAGGVGLAIAGGTLAAVIFAVADDDDISGS